MEEHSKPRHEQIARHLRREIREDYFQEGDKLPSEKAISIKYEVSRIVSTKVLSELRKIGAIYSIPKKGNFVAQYFSSLLKPLSYEYNIDSLKTTQDIIEAPSFFKENN